MGVQIDALHEIGRPPAPQASVMQALSLGEPGKLEQALTSAGFRDVQTSSIPTPRGYASVSEAASALRSSSPAQAELMRQLSESERERYVALIEARLAGFAQADGQIVIPGEAILAVGTR
jgi:hypothetical protein